MEQNRQAQEDAGRQLSGTIDEFIEYDGRTPFLGQTDGLRNHNVLNVFVAIHKYAAAFGLRHNDILEKARFATALNTWVIGGINPFLVGYPPPVAFIFHAEQNSGEVVVADSRAVELIQNTFEPIASQSDDAQEGTVPLSTNPADNFTGDITRHSLWVSDYPQ